MQTRRSRLEEFFFPPMSDRWLTMFRIGLGVQIVAYCLSLHGEWQNIFALQRGGWINRDLTEAILTANTSVIPRIGWLINVGNSLGLGEAALLKIIWSSLLVAGCFLVVGLFCRTAAIIAWFLYVCAAKSGNLLAYGVDTFTIAGLFYLMFAPFPDRYALDQKLWRSPIKDRYLHGFFRRVLQLHLCVTYFSGGISKCLGSGWWTGESMWRALTRPPFNILPVHLVIAGSAVLPLLGIAVLVLETGYPIFIWPKRTRLIWLVSILGMHIGIGLTMGLYLFALIMIILNLAAFGPGLLRPEKPEGEFTATERDTSKTVSLARPAT